MKTGVVVSHVLVHTYHLGVSLKYSSALVGLDGTQDPAFPTGSRVTVRLMVWGLCEAKFSVFSVITIMRHRNGLSFWNKCCHFRLITCILEDHSGNSVP